MEKGNIGAKLPQNTPQKKPKKSPKKKVPQIGDITTLPMLPRITSCTSRRRKNNMRSRNIIVVKVRVVPKHSDSSQTMQQLIESSAAQMGIRMGIDVSNEASRKMVHNILSENLKALQAPQLTDNDIQEAVRSALDEIMRRAAEKTEHENPEALLEKH